MIDYIIGQQLLIEPPASLPSVEVGGGLGLSGSLAGSPGNQLPSLGGIQSHLINITKDLCCSYHLKIVGF